MKEYKTEITLTENELQNIANGVVLLIGHNNSDTELGSFPELMNLLSKINEKLDEATFIRAQQSFETNIVAVKYEDMNYPKTFSGRAYSYFTNINLKVGDIVEAPTRYGQSIARVAEVNITEDRIKDIKPCMKTITKKINRDMFLNNIIVEDAA